MPSSTLRHLGGQVGTPVMQPALRPTYRPSMVLIGNNSYEAFGEDLNGVVTTNAYASNTYPAANRALGYMFTIADSFLVQKVWWFNGTTATTDNADVGVYTEAGSTLLVSGGSTAIATANVVQEKDCTDTLLVGPGRYWCVYNQNGTTATPYMTPAVAAALRIVGCAQFAGAVPLGSSFTPAAIASANFPLFGIAGRTQVA